MHVFIAGAGPIGMITALMLQARGIKVTLADPRAGVFTRPGNIDRETISSVENLVNKEIKVSEASHIKELERILYQTILERKITILPKGNEFTTLTPGGVKTSHEEKSFIPCDVVLDCTGSARAVVKNINELKKELEAKVLSEKIKIELEDKKDRPLAFNTISAAINPMDSMLLACGQIKNKKDAQYLLAQQYANEENDAKGKTEPAAYTYKYILGLEKLRAEFGWTKKTAPFFKIRYTKRKQDKVIVYCERPDSLPKERIAEWVQANLALRAERNVEFIIRPPTSRKYGKKPHSKLFTVQPLRLDKSNFTLDGFPPVLPLGDSQIDPDFRLGHGISNGIQRIQVLVGELVKLKNKDISTADFTEYDKHMTHWLLEHEVDLKTYYSGRLADLSDERFNLKNLYLSITDKLFSSEENKGYIPPLTENLYEQFNILITNSHTNVDAEHLLNSLKNDPRLSPITLAFIKLMDSANLKDEVAEFKQANEEYQSLFSFRQRFVDLNRILTLIENEQSLKATSSKPSERGSVREASSIREALTRVKDFDMKGLSSLENRLKELRHNNSAKAVISLGLLSTPDSERKDDRNNPESDRLVKPKMS